MNKTSPLQLKEISSKSDIPAELINSPFADLLSYHNLSEPFQEYKKAEMTVVMCMDNRKQLKIPNRFSYILRTAGARITGNEFMLSFAIGFAGIRHVALIGHTNCGMVNLSSKKEQTVEGLVKNAGWTKEQAENHFLSFAPFCEIEDASGFVTAECKRLKEKYPKISFVPMLFKVEDNKLYLIE